MTRRVVWVTGALAFVAIAIVLARWLQTDNVERDRVERLLSAQARGDAATMARQLERCDAACEERMARLAARLGRRGRLEIVRYDSETSRALTSRTGAVRVVWRLAEGLPTVQCVTVRRQGDAVTGPRVTLLALSAPIAREGAC